MPKHELSRHFGSRNQHGDSVRYQTESRNKKSSWSVLEGLSVFADLLDCFLIPAHQPIMLMYSWERIYANTIDRYQEPMAWAVSSKKRDFDLCKSREMTDKQI